MINVKYFQTDLDNVARTSPVQDAEGLRAKPGGLRRLRGLPGDLHCQRVERQGPAPVRPHLQQVREQQSRPLYKDMIYRKYTAEKDRDM